jgi:CRISPR/Cas system CSM-associated protein Csm2 small subunit
MSEDNFKDDLKEMDRKSLQEWIDSHAYDSSCAVCANEASINLSNEMPEDQVRKLLTQCVYREAEAFINKNKSTIPITGSKIIDQETDVCGTTEIKVNI